jgi:uncharacterized protein (TIGR00299 family) protein
MRIHFDPVGGAAGDMIVAALLDAFPQHQGAVVFAIARAAPDVDLAIVRHNDGVLQGRRFKATLDGHVAEHEHHHHDHHDHSHHDHDHRAWREIRRHLMSCGLEDAVARHAIGIFTGLAEAEGKVHGIAPEDVAFHEVGAWDSIADIVGAAALIAAIGAESWTVGALPLGSGLVKTAHGLLPVPAPATALLMQGFETLDDGVPGERVTPTGMAVLRYLCKGQGSRNGLLERSGVGFGTRTLPGMSNCLRVLVFDAAAGAPTETVEVIEFEVDDQSPEDLAAALDHLRDLDGVLDVLQAPAFGKKGRLVSMVRLLAEPDALGAVTDAVFEHTATIGLRHHRVARAVLPRRVETVWVDRRAIRVKIVERPGGPTAKAEADDLPDEGRADFKRRAEAAALKGSA